MSKLIKSYWSCCWLKGSIKDLERNSLYSGLIIKFVLSTSTLHCWASLSWVLWIMKCSFSSSMGMEVSATLEYWPVSSCTSALKFEALVFTFTGLEIYVTLISFLSLLLALLFFMVQVGCQCATNRHNTNKNKTKKWGCVYSVSMVHNTCVSISWI